MLPMQGDDPQMSNVELSTTEYDRHVVVALRGELDVADAASVTATLAPLAAGGRRVVVDLETLEFIDSSGLASLVRARQLARQAGSDLVLAAPQQQILRMLALTRLTEVFAVHARVAEAAGDVGRDRAPTAPPAASTAVLVAT